MKIEKEQVWLGCTAVGAVMAYLAVYDPSMIMLALIFIIVGIKGILFHVM